MAQTSQPHLQPGRASYAQAVTAAIRRSTNGVSAHRINGIVGFADEQVNEAGASGRPGNRKGVKSFFFLASRTQVVKMLIFESSQTGASAPNINTSPFLPTSDTSFNIDIDPVDVTSFKAGQWNWSLDNLPNVSSDLRSPR